MAKSAGYVSPDYLRKAAELTQQLKQCTYELMQLTEGVQVLDIGCGPGIDTIALARQVGVTGKVFGVDIDREMLQQADDYARQEGLSDRIKHREADVLGLPFDDVSLDACRAERLFQVLPARYVPQEVLQEICRVVKPGGGVVLADTDWATASVDYPDYELERRLMNYFAYSMRPNGIAGRQFYRLMLEAGLRDISINTFPMVLNDFSQTPFGQWLVDEAIKSGTATAEEMSAWLSTHQEESGQGRFYASVNMVVVSGMKA